MTTAIPDLSSIPALAAIPTNPPIEALVPISDITLDRDLQFRTFTDMVRIEDLKSSFEADGKFHKKIELNRYVDPSNGKAIYWIKDGTHRLLAAKGAGATSIEALVYSVKSKEEAMFSAMGVNVLHGKAATTEDLKLAMEAIRTSSIAHEFKREANPFMWDKDKLRKIFKCSPRKLDNIIQDTAALMRMDLNYKVEKLWSKGVRTCDIARELGILYGSAETIVNRLKKEAKERAKAIEARQVTKTDEKDETANSVTSDEEPIFEDLVLDDDEKEDTGLPIDIQALTASFERKAKDSVIKPSLTPAVCMDEAKAMIQSMTPEQQSEIFVFLQDLTQDKTPTAIAA